MITPEGTLTFPNIFKSAENLSKVLKYSGSLLIDKSDKDGIAKLQREVDKAIAKGKEKLWNGKKPKFRYEPLRDGDKELKEEEKTGKEYEGVIFLNASCNGDEGDRPPGVVGADAQPLLDQSKLYSGCRVRLDITAFPYKNGGNCGVGWWLNNVMVVGDGPRLDGKMDAVDAFKDFSSGEVTGEEMTTTENDNLA